MQEEEDGGLKKKEIEKTLELEKKQKEVERIQAARTKLEEEKMTVLPSDKAAEIMNTVEFQVQPTLLYRSLLSEQKC